jgi:SAM-dependent methyltransferase
MNQDVQREIRALHPERLSVAEVSGDLWGDWEWGSRTVFHYKDLDLCNPPAELPQFDLVLCEQVLEHVIDPITAVRTLRRLCKADGHVLVSTPFLVRLHPHPTDFWRFTPEGLRVLLSSQGLEPLWVRSWGNRKAAVATFDRWAIRQPWHRLNNEPDFPLVVWSLARPAQTSTDGPAALG